MVLCPSRRQVLNHDNTWWGHGVEENRAFACVYVRGDTKQLPGMYVATGFNRKRDRFLELERTAGFSG